MPKEGAEDLHPQALFTCASESLKIGLQNGVQGQRHRLRKVLKATADTDYLPRQTKWAATMIALKKLSAIGVFKDGANTKRGALE